MAAERAAARLSNARAREGLSRPGAPPVLTPEPVPEPELEAAAQPRRGGLVARHPVRPRDPDRRRRGSPGPRAPSASSAWNSCPSRAAAAGARPACNRCRARSSAGAPARDARRPARHRRQHARRDRPEDGRSRRLRQVRQAVHRGLSRSRGGRRNPDAGENRGAQEHQASPGERDQQLAARGDRGQSRLYARIRVRRGRSSP